VGQPLQGVYLKFVGVFKDDIELKELMVSLSILSFIKSMNSINDLWNPEIHVVSLSGTKK